MLIENSAPCSISFSLSRSHGGDLISRVCQSTEAEVHTSTHERALGGVNVLLCWLCVRLSPVNLLFRDASLYCSEVTKALLRCDPECSILSPCLVSEILTC